jgi:hypothetical protein
MPTISEICQDAALELGSFSPGDPFAPLLAGTLLYRLNRMLDSWNAEHEAIYAQQFLTYTLTPSLSPHTIGPTGATWTLASGRPVSIESASLILAGGTTSAYVPIHLREAQWWADQQVPTLTSLYSTDLYYEPNWPLGNLFFWPVPTAANQVEIEIRRALAQVVLTDTFSLPPGYQEAITLTLAEQAARPLGKPIDASLIREASKARARIFANNVPTPTICTQDAGMPSGADSPTLPTWNYLIGS